MKYLFAIISFFFCSVVYSQITTGKFGAYNWMASIPAGSGKLPVFIFIPGSGESGTNVNALYTYSPMGFIRDGKLKRKDMAFIAIQPTKGPASWKWVVQMLDSIFSKPAFRADPNRFYLSGLSYGAASIFDYIKNTPADLFRLPAAVIPMSITTNAQCGDFYANTDYLCGTDLRYENIPAWGFAGSGDSHFGKMKRFFQRLIEAGYNARWTTYQGGHCCWGNFYNPDYRENGKNVYDWAIQYSVGGVLPVKLADFRSTQFGLIWSTLNESNTSHFIVEWSSNGLNFEPVGRVEAVGNSQTKATYKWDW